MDLADSFVTCKNPNGLVSLSVHEKSCILAVPDEKAGSVKVINFANEKKVIDIKAHNSSLGMIKLS